VLPSGGGFRARGSSWLWEDADQGAVSCYGVGNLNFTDLSIPSKTHKTYSIEKLKIVLGYIRNAHPGVVDAYHILDDLTKQMLCGGAFTMQPTEIAWQEKIRYIAAVPKTLQQLEEDWKLVDFDAESKRLVGEFC
jgi:hypothetical protein